LNPAKAVGAEDRFGSLRPGKAADLVILDRNIYRTPPEELRQVRPVMTIVGGEVRFVREA
jgi:predicted amidohydrolase YtcJ